MIAYLRAENRVLREQLTARGKRIRFSDRERRKLARVAKALGRRLLRALDTLVTPDTLLRWHRELIAAKYDGSAQRKLGRPRLRAELEALIVRMANENRWGYLRIQGALANLGFTVARTTVANVLARHGVDRSPERKTSWKEFLRSHWETIGATDFFTVELWRPVGLVRYHVLFAIELATRRVHLAGIIEQPHGGWMAQIARNLTDTIEGFLVSQRYLIHDRDPLFTNEFRHILATAGVESIRLPARSPNLNAHAERFVLSIKAECLSRLILFSEGQLRRAVTAYLEHYHGERNHQGLGNRLPDARQLAANSDGAIECHERLGGLLRYYHRNVA